MKISWKNLKWKLKKKLKSNTKVITKTLKKAIAKLIFIRIETKIKTISNIFFFFFFFAEDARFDHLGHGMCRGLKWQNGKWPMVYNKIKKKTQKNK